MRFPAGDRALGSFQVCKRFALLAKKGAREAGTDSFFRLLRVLDNQPEGGFVSLEYHHFA